MEKHESMKMEVSNLKMRLAEYEASEASMSDKNITLQEDMELARQRLHNAEEELQIRKQEIDALRNKAASFVSDENTTISTLEKQLYEFRHENARLKGNLSEKNEEIENLKMSLNKTEEYNITMESQVGELKQHNKLLLERVSSMADASEALALKERYLRLKENDKKNKEKVVVSTSIYSYMPNFLSIFNLYVKFPFNLQLTTLIFF